MMRMMTTIPSKFLSDRNYDIEFNGYLSNHSKHGIIALHRLNASDERIQEWWINIQKKHHMD